jgi:DNA-binding transcriptional ArsR family regulator
VNTYQEQHHQLDALGDATRRAILERLASGALPVGELARDFPITRPAISQHLRILKRARLVTDHAVGNRRLYQLNPEGIEALRAYFDRFWTGALASFKAAVEQHSAKEGR